VLQVVKGDTNDEFDDIITRQLGFKPVELAAAITLPEHLMSHYAVELGLEPATEEDLSLDAKICMIGDAFAALNDPDTYPSGTKASRQVVGELEQLIGPSPTETIFKASRAAFPHYLALSSQFDKMVQPSSAGTARPNPYGKALLQKNSYISKLPTDLQTRFAEVYQLIKKNQVSPEAIQLLVSDLIPAAGYSRGCIYLMENRELTLTPRLRIGSGSINRYRALSCIDPGLETNPIVHAFSCSYPVKETNIVFLGEHVSLVAGALGTSERAGVLYLEVSNATESGRDMDSLQLFRAIRQCMNE
jgi:hypothetical protein